MVGSLISDLVDFSTLNLLSPFQVIVSESSQSTFFVFVNHGFIVYRNISGYIYIIVIHGNSYHFHSKIVILGLDSS